MDRKIERIQILRKFGHVLKTSPNHGHVNVIKVRPISNLNKASLCQPAEISKYLYSQVLSNTLQQSFSLLYWHQPETDPLYMAV